MGINSFNKRVDYGDIKYFCASWVFFEYLICLALGYILNRIGLRNSGANVVIFYTVLVIMIVLSMKHNPKIKRTHVVTGIAYILVMGIAVLYSKIFSPTAFELDKSGVNCVELFVYYLTIIIIYMSIEDFDKLMHMLGQFARVLSPVLLVYFGLEYIRNGYSFSGYDMVQGYQASLCALVLFNNIKHRKAYYDIIMFVIMTALAFFGGSRGAALVILVFVGLNIVFSVFTIPSLSWRCFLAVFIVIVAVLVYLYYYDTIVWLARVLNKFGVYSRTIESFLGSPETIESNLERINLFRACTQSWNDMPIFGYGILGDRLFTNGIYPHNVFIEMITHYGFFGGIGLILTVLAVSVYQCIKSKKRELLLLLIAFTFTHLMISGTYLKVEQVFIWIGVILNKAYKDMQTK